MTKLVLGGYVRNELIISFVLYKFLAPLPRTDLVLRSYIINLVSLSGLLQVFGAAIGD